MARVRTDLCDTIAENVRKFYTIYAEVGIGRACLIVDYVGVLDGPDEDQRRWRNLLAAARAHGIGTAVLSNDPGGPAADPIRVLQTQGIVDAVILSGEIGGRSLRRLRSKRLRMRLICLCVIA
ncbi:Haloacid dehalogenase-like hydrolase [Corynebacterium diphtheriae bv. mitis]|nr:Haloacid dehalogenase-like hydrolase [Corynebacterium diphtheriae bv. mitis]